MPIETPDPQPGLAPPQMRFRRRRNHYDGTGTVRIRVELVQSGGGGRPIKGNIMRSYSIPHTKVSAVATQIDRLMAEGQLPACGTLRHLRAKKVIR